jgi:hypothetical protein
MNAKYVKKSFLRKDYLNTHKHIHTDDKLYEWTICQKRFHNKEI